MGYVNETTLYQLKAIEQMNTTYKIASELDKVIDEVGCLDPNTLAITSAVLLAAMRMGVVKLTTTEEQ